MNYNLCKESENIMSYRENSSEQLVIALFNEHKKTYKLQNKKYVDKQTQKQVEKILKSENFKKVKKIDF